MLSGFPKKITTEKLARGHYRITREDGAVVCVRRGVGKWWVHGVCGISYAPTAKTLSVVQYDVAHGFTARDQLGGE